MPAFVEGAKAGGRYEIVRFIARGGMGEVYEAIDTVLDTRVALKTLRTELERSTSAVERFRREMGLARSVTDPHVCRLYDVGEHEGRVFITMELLSGKPLTVPVTIDEVERLAPQLVRGLAALHAAGIVHRDFKTANIIATHDRAVLTDFGLARSIDAEPQLTLESSLLGTPAYMSPEQVEGRPATPASDIYALGVTLFELLTGTLPFTGDTAMAAATARLQQDPPRPSSVRTGVPSKWDRIVLRCLVRDPAARPSINDVLAPPGRSRRWFLAAGGCALAASSVGTWRISCSSEAVLNGHVAVLPVGGAKDLLTDPWRTALTIDIHDALVTTQLPIVTIHAAGMDLPLTGPAMRWARASDPVAQALRFPEVARVIQPALVTDSASMTLVLVTTTRDGTSTQRIMRPRSETARLACDAVSAIARAVDYPAPRPQRELPAGLYERYGAALATSLRRPTPDEQRRLAVGEWHPFAQLRRFSDEVPEHALAAVQCARQELADADQQEDWEHTQTRLHDAAKYLERAFGVEPDLPLAIALRGHAAMIAWDWKRADADSARAYALAPYDVRIRDKRTSVLQLLGRFPEMLEIVKRQPLLDERLGEAVRGYYYYYARRYEDCIRVLAPKIDVIDYSSFFESINIACLALAYADLARYDDAVRVADKIRPHLGRYACSGLVPIYLAAGRTADAKTLRDEVMPGLDLGEQAVIDDAFGDLDAALTKLERTVESHNVHARFLKIERYSGALRSRPRFQALMRTVFPGS
jgi:serine/threonine-protein kinase